MTRTTTTTPPARPRTGTGTDRIEHELTDRTAQLPGIRHVTIPDTGELSLAVNNNEADDTARYPAITPRSNRDALYSERATHIVDITIPNDQDALRPGAFDCHVETIETIY